MKRNNDEAKLAFFLRYPMSLPSLLCTYGTVVCVGVVWIIIHLGSHPPYVIDLAFSVMVAVGLLATIRHLMIDPLIREVTRLKKDLKKSLHSQENS